MIFGTFKKISVVSRIILGLHFSLNLHTTQLKFVRLSNLSVVLSVILKFLRRCGS